MVSFTGIRKPGSLKSSSCGIGTVIRVVVVTQPLLQVFGLAAVVAAGGLALKDVDVEGHEIFPDSSNGTATS